VYHQRQLIFSEAPLALLFPGNRQRDFEFPCIHGSNDSDESDESDGSDARLLIVMKCEQY
jgi:hypothetical protein